MPRPAQVAALCLAALLPLSACGGGTAHLTPSAYRLKADAICAVLFRTKGPEAGAPAASWAPILAALRSGRESLSSLEPPPSLAKLHAQVLAMWGHDVHLLARLLKQYEAGTINREVFSAKLLAGLPNDVPLWKKIGASTCANGL
jgi:hypothetical protein